MLDAASDATPEDLLGNWTDGRIKLFLTQRVLRFRRENAELFRHGNYTPLSLTGGLADCCIAFAREFEGRSIVVLAPRLSSRVGFPPIGEAWGDTAVQLPNDGAEARDLFTNDVIRPNDSEISLQQVFARLPVAALATP